MNKNKLILIGIFLILFTSVSAQRRLQDYLSIADRNSPLLVAARNRKAVGDEEIQRLKAVYTHSRLEFSGDALFVPVVSTENGKSGFRWNDQDGKDYYGYDLGESSGHIDAGLTWTKPLSGDRNFQTEKQYWNIRNDMEDDHIRLSSHDLHRLVTEQYLLCLLDEENERTYNSLDSLLIYQSRIVSALANKGLASVADLRLIDIERQKNKSIREQARQSFQSHHAELNILCGLSEPLPDNDLQPVDLSIQPGREPSSSFFLEQFRLDSLLQHTDLASYQNLYRPQLSLFVTNGVQTGAYKDLYRHFGVSAGLHLTWLLSDGKQMKHRQREYHLALSTIREQRNHEMTVRKERRRSLLEIMKTQDEQIRLSQQQLQDYRRLLADYTREIMAGRRSVIDYINVFSHYRDEIRNHNTLCVNKDMIVNTYNYWNW